MFSGKLTFYITKSVVALQPGWTASNASLSAGQAIGGALASGLRTAPQHSQALGSNRRALSGLPDGVTSRRLQAVPPGLDSLDLSVGMQWDSAANVSRLLGAVQDWEYPHKLTQDLQANGRVQLLPSSTVP